MLLSLPVIIGALGYFIDIFDLFLFSIVRVSSLTDLGVPKESALSVGVFLLDTQMVGLLIGGIGWGVLGDKKGRRAILFGSIFLYSSANLANGFVTSIPMYAACRFFAGLGLAGELGAAITLVSESLSAERRGYGTTIVASFGLLGAMAAALVGEILPWRTAFLVGGALGLGLLVLRLKLEESTLYQNMNRSRLRSGDFRLFLSSPQRLLKYLSCVLVGIPIYFVVGILITFSPEFAEALGINGPIVAGRAVLYSYLGAALGDLASGLISQRLRNRKRIIALSLWVNFAMILLFLFSRNSSPSYFYFTCVLVGLTTGYWTVLITLAAEQFGTNLRATVTTSVPNLVRSSVVPLSLGFKYLKQPLGLGASALVIGLGVTVIAALALRNLDETYGRELNYLEG